MSIGDLGSGKNHIKYIIYLTKIAAISIAHKTAAHIVVLKSQYSSSHPQFLQIKSST